MPRAVLAGAGTVGFTASGTIAMAATYDVTGTTIDASVNGTVNFTGTIPSIGATLLSQSGTLNFGTSALDATTLTMTGGTLTSTAAMTVSGLATLSSGTISGSGAVNANGGILFNVSNAFFTLDGRTLTNPAGQTATWTGINSKIVLSDGAVFDNLGVFQDQCTAQHEVQNGAGAAGSFNDDGSFIKSASSSQGTFLPGVSFNVTSGSVDVQTGTLELLGGGTDTGATFTSEVGATLDFGGSHTLDAASSVGGAGTVGFTASGTIAMAATYDVTGTTIDASVNGTVNFTGTIPSIGATLLSQSGTLNFGTIALDATTLTMTGGTLTSTAAMTVSGLATLSSGTISGSGAVNANGGILFNVSNAYFTLDGRTLTNPAGQTATWTGINSNIVLSDGAVFDNLGVFQDQCTAGHEVQNGAGAAGSFNDDGSFIKSASSSQGTFLPGVSFNVTSGSVDVQTGTLDLLGGGTATNSAFTIESGTTLEFGASTAFTFDSGSTLSGAGNLVKNGSSVLSLDGTSPNFTGPTTVTGGTLEVDGSQPNSPIAVETGAILSGSGTVDTVTTTSASVSPGDGSGILTALGDVTFDSASTFLVELDGANPGAGGYDQLNVTGTVTLNESTLSPSLGFTPTNGETFTIIKSTAPIVGTFSGLAEGSSLTINNVPFHITYEGGGGHDVVLTQAVQPAPMVTGLSPTSGPGAGGTLVTITGSGFTGATAVEFGTSAATNVAVVNDTTITADSPAGSGTVDVTVTTPAGKSTTSSPDQFSYIAAPAITGLSPSSGPDAGGTPVTITGTGFTGATAVDFGTTAVTNFSVVNSTTIKADSPAGTGIVGVTVSTPVGTSTRSSADQFTYFAASTISSLNPTTGPAAGGTLVTISGTGFTGATSVDFGTNPATSLRVVNDTTITADSPAGSGVVDVTVITPVGTSATSPADQFTYTAIAAPTVAGISPSTGPASGGTLVTITGAGFTSATAVDFGTTVATDVKVVNDTTITADSPAGSGAVNVTVTTPAGTSATSSADQFTFIAASPMVMSVSRFGYHMHPTSLVIQFNGPLDPATAENVRGYTIIGPGGQTVAVASAIYDADTRSVTLLPPHRLNVHYAYGLIVRGTGSDSIKDGAGVAIDGAGNGTAGSNYETKITAANLVILGKHAHVRKDLAAILAKEKRLLASRRVK